MATATKPAKPRLFMSSGWYALGLLLLALLAFWPVYIARLPFDAEAYVHVHTAGVVLWMAFLVSQPLLIARGRRPLHRRIGRLSYVLVPFIAIGSILLAHSRTAAMPAQTFAAEGNGLYLAAAALFLFLACYALAIRNRRDPFIHSRYMIATVLPLIDPVSFRLLLFYSPLTPSGILFPAIGYAITDIILLLLAFTDRDEPRAGKAFLRLLPLFVLVHLGWFTIGQTRAWLALCAAFRALPLT
ncbi:MAG TPA: hypothetical protein VEW26_11165 [Allosphingosinicella sp.]|nr:hypothetical protein [Allosphingosinicella sp.]